MDQLAERPKVSVCVVTYNQVAYIRQCLQSIVEQTTNFEFEIIIGDDYSTDGTREIVSEFRSAYPRIVRTLFHPNNIGPYENYLTVHQAAIGEYIAHMDGDDYALPGKLQAQADTLDNDRKCIIVWHAMDRLMPNGSIRETCLNRCWGSGRVITRTNQIEFITIANNSSKMYRSEVKNITIPPHGFIDFYLNVMQLRTGYGLMLCNRSFGVYRVGVGISTAGYKTRIILISNLSWLLANDPETRPCINSASIHLLLSDIKRRAPTFIASLTLFVHSFSVRGMIRYFRTLPKRLSIQL